MPTPSIAPTVKLKLNGEAVSPTGPTTVKFQVEWDKDIPLEIATNYPVMVELVIEDAIGFVEMIKPIFGKLSYKGTIRG